MGQTKISSELKAVMDEIVEDAGVGGELATNPETPEQVLLHASLVVSLRKINSWNHGVLSGRGKTFFVTIWIARLVVTAILYTGIFWLTHNYAAVGPILLAMSIPVFWVRSRFSPSWKRIMMRTLPLVSVVLLVVMWRTNPSVVHDFNLYLVAGLILMTLLALRNEVRDHEIEFSKTNGVIDGIHLGRVSNLTSTETYGHLLLALFAAFVSQTCLIYYSSEHLDLPFGSSVLSASLMSLNNLAHGLTVGIPSLFGISIELPETAKLGRVAAITLGMFRIFFDAVIAVGVFFALRRWMAKQIFKVDRIMRGIALLRWMDTELLDSRSGWGREFYDEYMFLLLASEYIKGNYDFVRSVSRRCRHIRVSADIRASFVNTDGEQIFWAPSSNPEELENELAETVDVGLDAIRLLALRDRASEMAKDSPDSED